MTVTHSLKGRMVLIVDHCAGMVDLVALPVWVGALIAGYRLNPQQAGGLVTLYLLGAVTASTVFARLFQRLNGRFMAALGFAGAALAFFSVASNADYAALALLHVLGGFCAGTGLSFTHGTIGRSANPHRLFSLVSMALGVFSALFLSGVPPIVAAWGEPVLFKVFAAVMVLASLAAAIAFPVPDTPRSAASAPHAGTARLPATAWLCIGGVSCLALVQAMLFSFIERMGMDRGFGRDRVSTVLVVIGLLAIVAPALAAVLEKRLNARRVVAGGAIVQGLLAWSIANSPSLATYATCGVLLVGVILFTHSFAFGELARLDSSGRAVAATPAMLMIGAAMGPILGGMLVKNIGYAGLGTMAVVVDAVALLLFLSMNHRSLARRPLPA